MCINPWCSTDLSIYKIHFLCRFGSGSGQIWLDEADCTGNELCLLSCSNNGIGVSDCGHFEDVAIFCSGSRSPSTNCSGFISKYCYMYQVSNIYIPLYTASTSSYSSVVPSARLLV